MQVNDVFSRTQANAPLLSHRSYNLVIGLALCWGFLVNFLMVQQVPLEPLQEVHPLLFLLGYFACCMAGVSLFNGSDKPAVSFLGYNLVVIPFGLVINLLVSRYDQDLVLDAVRTTGVVTAVMMLLGASFPRFFQRISGGLGVALVAVIVVEMISWLFFGVHHGALDWIVAGLFCGYIGYDWARANAIPKTLDNAIDSAAALYMDIINLFIRILRIMGRRR